MNKKRIISLALAMALSTGLLTGCGDKTQAHVSGDSESIVVTDREEYLASNDVITDQSFNKIDSYETVPEAKEFEPGEHLFMLRYDLLDELGYYNPESINSLSISIPEGYEILSMENFIGLGGKIGTCQTYGVDIWFINNEKVLVSPFYNEEFKHYDYSQPGSVIIDKDDISVTEDKRIK